ncbi:MAG: competence/damage-inducible protein A [Gemmatimonadetes bacterium]|nr:competence/damage-inducible protein A [Gemmatimonadota bacterium]
MTIGDELLLGFTVDTNAAHLARAPAARGVAIVRRSTCGDDASEIAAAVREALDRTGAVITTGGLGPTADDMTKEAIAALFGRGMRLDEAIVESLRARWLKRGWGGELPKSNLQQAMIPEGCEILVNNHGSAPGIWLEDARGRWVAMLPGVPREMRGMLADALMPRIEARLAAATSAPTVIRSRTLRTTGIAESALADKLGELAKAPFGLSLAYLPQTSGVDLRLTSRGRTAAEADALLARGATALRERIGPVVYGEGVDDLAAVVLQTMRERHLTLALAESCTGGLLGARLTAIPGSSDVLLGGVVAYANAVKQSQLGVREATLSAHGAVSEETAREMALGARERLGASVAIAVTGVAGPGGGTPEKPVGHVCFAVAIGDDAQTFTANLIGDRAEIRERAAQTALNALRRALAT